MQLSMAWEFNSSPTMELTDEERHGLDEVVGLLLDAGDVIEAENVMRMFGMYSRTVDIIAVRSFESFCTLIVT